MTETLVIITIGLVMALFAWIQYHDEIKGGDK